MDPSAVLDRLAQAGLNRIIPDIQKLMQESIRLTSRPTGAFTLPVGCSRLGGLPDMPANVGWPLWKGDSMSFVGQIRLEDITPFAPAAGLPTYGLLSFFYDARQETYGADVQDRGGWKVFYFGDRSRAWRPGPAPADLPAEARFTACPLTFSTEISLPSSPRQHLPNLDWTRDEIRLYEDFLSSYPNPQDYAKIHHRMFGHPNQIQDDMQLQCSLFANGITSEDDPRAAQFTARKVDWQLLLQVDSDENAGMKWATAGMLYFWIEKGALQAQQFNQTWMVLQAE